MVLRLERNQINHYIIITIYERDKKLIEHNRHNVKKIIIFTTITHIGHRLRQVQVEFDEKQPAILPTALYNSELFTNLVICRNFALRGSANIMPPPANVLSSESPKYCQKTHTLLSPLLSRQSAKTLMQVLLNFVHQGSAMPYP